MPNSATIFVALNILLFALDSVLGGMSIILQLAIATILIGFVGIPHGAIDHILFMQNTKASPLFFYTFYFGLIGSIVVLWIHFPTIGLLVFLLLSAYHFGQSQFSRYSKQIPRFSKTLLYLSWGLSILSGLVVYNYPEIKAICESSQDLNQLLIVFQPTVHAAVLLISSTIFLGVLFYHQRVLSKRKFYKELLILALIHLSFYTHSVLIGFSIYFATLHSLEVLKDEFAFLKTKLSQFNLSTFLRILLPYSLLSLVGLISLLAFSHFGMMTMDKILVVFVAISALTLPHSVVMEKFYQAASKRR